jgi:hypothetical protein
MKGIYLFLLVCMLTVTIHSRDYSKRAWKMRDRASKKKESVAHCRSFNSVLFKKIQDTFYRAVSEYDIQHYQFSAELFQDVIELCEAIEETEQYADVLRECEQNVRNVEDLYERSLMYNGMYFYKNKMEQAAHYLGIAQNLIEKGIHAFENGEVSIISRRHRFENINANCKKIKELLKGDLEKLQACYTLSEEIRILEDKIEAYKNSWIISKEAKKFAMLRDWFEYEKQKYIHMKDHFNDTDIQEIQQSSHRFNEFDIALTRLIREPAYLKVVDQTDQNTTDQMMRSGSDKMLYVIKKGDSLWNISSKLYNDPTQWRKLYNMNKSIVEKPELIYPDEVLEY